MRLRPRSTASRTPSATALGAAFVLAALSSHNVLSALGLAALGVILGVAPLRRLLPAGTLRADRGLPATILSRGLLTFAFFGADAYVTLTITTLRGHSTLMAGAVVTASTLAWTAGSWVQARLNDRGRAPAWCGPAWCSFWWARAAWSGSSGPGVPVGEAFVAWSIAGFGMGLSYAPISLDDAAGRSARPRGLGLGLTEPGRRARHCTRRRHRRRRRGRLLAGARPVTGGVVIAFAVAAARRRAGARHRAAPPGSLARTVETPVSR